MADDTNEGADEGPSGAALDVDGDGEADVVVPGLTGGRTIEMHPGRGDTEAFEVMVGYEAPPTSSPCSPMGQIEHMGYALRSETARTGWRRTIIHVSAWALLATFVAAIIASLVR